MQPRGYTIRRRTILPLAVALMVFAGAACVRAQGGPPFTTDDPGTPGNGNWEINIGWTHSHNPGHGSYQLPDLDINYGLGSRIQLKYEVPLALAVNENNTVIAGLGDSFPGVKIRFYEHHRAGEL